MRRRQPRPRAHDIAEQCECNLGKNDTRGHWKEAADWGDAVKKYRTKRVSRTILRTADDSDDALITSKRQEWAFRVCANDGCLFRIHVYAAPRSRREARIPCPTAARMFTARHTRMSRVVETNGLLLGRVQHPKIKQACMEPTTHASTFSSSRHRIEVDKCLPAVHRRCVNTPDFRAIASLVFCWREPQRPVGIHGRQFFGAESGVLLSSDKLRQGPACPSGFFSLARGLVEHSSRRMYSSSRMLSRSRFSMRIIFLNVALGNFSKPATCSANVFAVVSASSRLRDGGKYARPSECAVSSRESTNVASSTQGEGIAFQVSSGPRPRWPSSHSPSLG